MEVNFYEGLSENSLNYKKSLDRIIDKYSKLQYQTGGIEVDLDSTNTRALEHYMKLSKTQLSKMEEKSVTDLRDESMRAQDITRTSQLDFTHQDVGGDETSVSSVSSTQFSVEDDGMGRSGTTQLSTSSLDESHRNLSETELQPEDQDEELEMSLRNHGSSWVELYPSMISRIERAWHRQHVSDAADLVLRRYRRWRQQPNRSYVNNTFIVSNPRKMTSKKLLKESSNSPVKIHFMDGWITEASPHSPLQIVTNQQDRQAQQQSPGRVRGSLHQPVLVMDLSGSSETSKTKDLSLNETFNMSQLETQPSAHTVSPSRPFYPALKASLDWSLSAQLPQTDGCSTFASQSAPDIYGSPVRKSPSKSRILTGFSRSPAAFSRSPTAHPMESFPTEPVRPRSVSTFLSSPPQKSTVPLRMLHPQDPHHPLQVQLPSPRSATAARERNRFRRHLSFDSSLPLSCVSYSLKQLDQDFIKLYHKFVCQNKSSLFNGLPCRFCAGNSGLSRGHSSSALAALALSPHRSLLRKRHRELSLDSHPQSKRFRDEHCASSPGSKRHGNEMLRRRLSMSDCEQPHNGFSYSPSKHSMSQRLSSQQRSADVHQDSWNSRRCSISAEFSGLGGSFERKMSNGNSPRKW